VDGVAGSSLHVGASGCAPRGPRQFAGEAHCVQCALPVEGKGGDGTHEQHTGRSSLAATLTRDIAHYGLSTPSPLPFPLPDTQTPVLDMLQFHWWDYDARGQMMDAMRHLNDLRKEGLIRALSLTNFDTPHVKAFLDAGIPIASNQVQFSVVDMRPAAAMAPLCAAHGVKLLTYGTLLGGLLSDKWLGAPEPRSRADLPTPSQGKYYNMIRSWGGWALFQEMLRTLRDIGRRHGDVSISVVGVRFILDQRAVGGVIVGLRAGLSEHSDDLSRALTLTLTDADRAAIAAVQARANDLMRVIGDCGDEYRG